MSQNKRYDGKPKLSVTFLFQAEYNVMSYFMIGGDKHQAGRQIRLDTAMANFKIWIKAAGIRAARTVAQTAIAAIGTSAALGDVNWLIVGSTSLLAGVLSLLTSVAGLPECNDCGNDKK